MISNERALRLIQDSLSSLWRVGLLEHEVVVGGDTVLLGTGSPLDSIAFVTFVTDLEDRLNQQTNQEIFLVLNEIQEFNIDNPYLTAGTIAQYIVRLIEEQERTRD